MKKIILTLGSFAIASPVFAAGEAGFSNLKLSMLLVFNLLAGGVILFGVLAILSFLLDRARIQKRRTAHARKLQLRGSSARHGSQQGVAVAPTRQRA